MKVLKFGGTSVGSPERMRQVADISCSVKGAKIIVLSALSGTTNALVKIGECLTDNDWQGARQEIESLYNHYLDFYKGLLSEDALRGKALKMIDEHFNFIRSLTDKSFDENLTKELLAQGELMSTKLFSYYLSEKGIGNCMLSALEFMAIDQNDEPDIDYIRTNLTKLLKKHPGHDLYITQGYICLNANQKIDNLKRGGSDYTASLIGAAVDAEIVQIWTDIDGMHNNDPRVVDKTKPVARLSFDEASELAYFGAKILHPSSILPAKQFSIPVQLKNTMDPEAFGTLISSDEQTKEVKAIAAKDGITAIKIKSARMLLAYGFLRNIFEIFERYRTPIDMITTSEVAVSLTIDNNAHLAEIIEELQTLGEVTVDENQTIICIVGNEVVSQRGIVKKIFNALENIPKRMISYGGSKYNISILTETAYKKEALSALNEELFDFA